MKVRLVLTPEQLEIPEMPLYISYDRIMNVQTIDAGWRKQRMMLTYIDEIGIEQNMIRGDPAGYI
jgi:hypothetical protein